MLKRLLYLAAFVVAALSLTQIIRHTVETPRLSANVDGIPVEVFLPNPPVNSLRPAIVIAHGYAGSKQVMYELAQDLTQGVGGSSAGFVTIVFDFSGHGANPHPFPADDRSTQLDADLDHVVAYARSLPFVDPNHIFVLGHSMGAGVAVQYAKNHPEIEGVVGISGGYTNVTPNAPKNLLLLAGEYEFANIKQAQTLALQNAGGETESDTKEPVRHSEVIPGVEHLTILWNDLTLSAIRVWLAALFGDHSPLLRRYQALEEPSYVVWLRMMTDSVGSLMPRVATFSVASAILFFPLASFAVKRFGGRRERSHIGAIPTWQVLLIAGVPAFVVPLVLRVAQVLPLDVTELLPIQIVDYLSMHFLLTGLLMGVGLWLLRGKDFAPWRDVRRTSLVGAALFLAWMVATNGSVAHLTWLNFIPTTATRLMLLPIVFILLSPYFVVSEYLTKSDSLRRSALNELVSKGLLLGSLLWAILLVPGLTFLLLVVALFAGFFVVYGAYALHLHALTRDPWLAALGYAAMTSAVLVAVFPVTA